MSIKMIATALLLTATLLTITACGNEITIAKNVSTKDTGATETSTMDIVEDIADPIGGASTKDYGYSTMFESDLAQFRLPQVGDTVVTLVTNYGDISLLMFPEAAPKTVENFVTHSTDDYYDGVTFHRVINNFMIQGGDPDGTGRGGQSIWGTPFEDEFNNDYFPFQGSIAMANSGAATNGSQFFIVHGATYNDQWDSAMTDYGFEDGMIVAHRALGGTPHLFNKHTVFGQVVKGMDVVDDIASVEVGTSDKPTKDVVIEDIVVSIVE